MVTVDVSEREICNISPCRYDKTRCSPPIAVKFCMEELKTYTLDDLNNVIRSRFNRTYRICQRYRLGAMCIIDQFFFQRLHLGHCNQSDDDTILSIIIIHYE